MKLDELIDLLGAISPILAAVISFFTAKYTSRKEIRKLELEWKRKDAISKNRDFLEMVAAVSRYSQSGWSSHQREAMEKISIIQAQHNDPLLRSLWQSVNSGNIADSLTYLQSIIESGTLAQPAPQKRWHKKRKQ